MTLAFTPLSTLSIGPALSPKLPSFCRQLKAKHIRLPVLSATFTDSTVTKRPTVAPSTKDSHTSSHSSGKPGLLEDSYFSTTEATNFWRHYDTAQQPQVLARSFRNHVRFLSTLLGDFRNLPYWFFTLTRLTYFSAVATVAARGAHPAVSDDSTFIPRTRGAQVINEALHTFRQDFESIRKGHYKLPWDMSLSHRQYSPLRVLRETAKLLTEVRSIFSKLSREDDDFSVWLDSKFLPDYYKQTYHLQTDGWLSSHSADMYEVSTESLFLGRQDAMQRSALIPITDYTGNCAIPESELNIVEVAAGTGRFATFVRDNWPRAQYIISDLSPFYLQKARENMSYWESMRADSSAALGNVRFLQAAAEDLPLADNSADVVYIVYLFHELPPQIREEVVGEVHRILRPGGLFVLTDSIQRGDVLDIDENLGSFSMLNEPWYETYIQESFVDLVCTEGKFKPMIKEVRSKTKTLSFTKCD